MKDIDIFLLDLYESPGLYGLFSVPGLEKHVLLMYAAHLIAVNKGKPLVFTLELSKEQWRDQMEKRRLSTDGITIIDTPSPSPDTIRMYIKNHSPSIILIHKMKLMEGMNLASALKKISTDFSTTIITTANLGRNSGDYDPMCRRPKIFDLIYTYNRKTTIGEFLDDLRIYNGIMLIHRNHDCDRNIGTAFRFNISNMAEIKIFRNNWAPPQSVFFDFTALTN